MTVGATKVAKPTVVTQSPAVKPAVKVGAPVTVGKAVTVVSKKPGVTQAERGLGTPGIVGKSVTVDREVVVEGPELPMSSLQSKIKGL